MPDYRVEFVNSVAAVSRQHWNGLFGETYPFMRHEFLLALEESGCTRQETGWQPHHLIVFDQAEPLPTSPLAIVPLFIKTHSWGEYVFDWSWADAYHHYGLTYYPKLVTAAPFTPATGPRIAIAGHQDQTSMQKRLAGLIQEEARRINASSWHCLFPEQAQCETLDTLHVPRRMGCQFHWLNQGYTDFAQFLDRFNSRKRKSLKRERRRVAEQHIECEIKTGTEITGSEWHLFYQFYHLTYFKRSGRQGYLNQVFFLMLAETMPENLMMVIASKSGKMVAAALFFTGGDALYGRYWGCAEEYEYLHFETCYYQGIDFAIERGLKKFDPGAQGEHKIQRGFTPVPTWSNHWIAREEFARAIDSFLHQEGSAMQQYLADAKSYLPFKQS